MKGRRRRGRGPWSAALSPKRMQFMPLWRTGQAAGVKVCKSPGARPGRNGRCGRPTVAAWADRGAASGCPRPAARSSSRLRGPPPARFSAVKVRHHGAKARKNSPYSRKNWNRPRGAAAGPRCDGPSPGAPPDREAGRGAGAGGCPDGVRSRKNGRRVSIF